MFLDNYRYNAEETKQHVVAIASYHFSNPDTSLKRYTDTGALVQEMAVNSPTFQRAFSPLKISLARTRFLHSGYRASGKILDSDMLYALALFALQPIQFINRYEWHTLSDLERCAIGTFWKSIGDTLGISYEVLPSGVAGARDGLHWLEELENRESADQTIAILVYMLPRALHPAALQLISCMMDNRLRKAMLYHAPTPFFEAVFSGLITVCKIVLRYLTPPRPYFLRYNSLTEKPDKNGRFFLTEWEAAPFYVKPTFWNRWGPMALVTRILGRPVPGDEGDKYYPSIPLLMGLFRWLMASRFPTSRVQQNDY
ncbi:hypothetical protein N7448_007372 [Penicillium atrosanguineum]|uniref:ER-bound oxygenase mpaB/mpaB'/Rubber oxygenase catalytic domain-containing protein n=1 Tax=Penicillium atrosanguineum TaxID=1132637 RepID=A0A9W9GPA1_9EURO|nr:uncharacterized protein N7443_001602 [Penicillium atrosanguineum]KAJ5126593.1 hypothetical protein N7448_007372 [Penicillium atrosanguineum]KAJ5314718.1 hypothetical protein N7443_001602 [Penicillium atrosanguineum]KAJ5331888.1 hypothetical protein N7476_001671 [Penicillium atrosanguineum]